jgi:hypothetical protein
MSRPRNILVTSPHINSAPARNLLELDPLPNRATSHDSVNFGAAQMPRVRGISLHQWKSFCARRNTHHARIKYELDQKECVQ